MQDARDDHQPNNNSHPSRAHPRANFPHTANPIALQNEPVVEFDRTRNPLRDKLLHDNFVLERGALLVPQGLGLGVKINEEVLAKYSTKR